MRADMDKRPFDVARMFDQVASRYDLLNDVLAVGQVRRWRRSMVQALALPAGARVLDLAAGTGTSTAALRAAGFDAVAADFSPGMIKEGRRRNPGIEFVQADATALPFEDASFDAVTISFGLRNVVRPRAALAEMARVVRPGGPVLICEFSTPTWRPWRTVYFEYLVRAMPKVARLVSSNPAAYDYLAESIMSWPNQAELREWMLEAGLQRCQYRNLSGGIVALHRGYVGVM